jgi:hypothetical protein
VEVFDRRDVSFVSITQQFNTTTSMGRLTLNVLLSFAQFEREVIGERVRDKIAASKKKGMWMGGQPPLGYDVKDWKLVVNEAEAHTVRHIFASPGEMRPTVMNLVRRVVISPDAVEIEVDRQQLTRVLQADGGGSPDGHGDATGNANPGDASDADHEDLVTLMIPARLQRAGREMRMVVQTVEDQRAPDPALLRALARAHDFRERLTQNPDLSAHDIARGENVTAAYIYATLRLAWLAPDITDAIVNGRQPPRLTAKKLFRLAAHLPLGWPQQRKLLGFVQESVPAA